MRKIFENNYAELYDISDEIPYTIFGYWKGLWLLDDPEAMRALRFPFDYIKDHHIKIMITDYRYLEIVPVETDAWLQSEWFPTVVKNGLLAEIVIDSTNSVFSKLSVDIMYENVHQSTGLLTPTVGSLEEAKQLARKLIAELHN
ncbi:MAG: hypothetical protein RMJ87_10775 [Cytophagales bacterium]|nr:hypothetical protein [Bernardetiaceae bacterium]MDW8205503.1 hypothetical protein [Cytophagales bacterium]